MCIRDRVKNLNVKRVLAATFAVCLIAILFATELNTYTVTKKPEILKPKYIIDHFVPKSADVLPKAKPSNPGGGRGKNNEDSSVSGGSEITGQRYAVVIGISDYEGTSNDLQYADDDALDWANYLESLGYEVYLLLDREATAQAIEDAINWLLSVEDEPGDAVVFVYSGHGSYDPQYGSMIISTDLVGITQSYFDEAFSMLDSQHAFFFFDACQIGGMEVLADTEAGRYVAMASNEHSFSYETSSLQHGVFTYYFLEDAIKTQGIIYVEQAFDYAVTQIKNTFPQMKPTEADTYSGDMTL